MIFVHLHDDGCPLGLYSDTETDHQGSEALAAYNAAAGNPNPTSWPGFTLMAWQVISSGNTGLG